MALIAYCFLLSLQVSRTKNMYLHTTSGLWHFRTLLGIVLGEATWFFLNSFTWSRENPCTWGNSLSRLKLLFSQHRYRCLLSMEEQILDVFQLDCDYFSQKWKLSGFLQWLNQLLRNGEVCWIFLGWDCTKFF